MSRDRGMGRIALSTRPLLATKARLRWDRREGKYLLIAPERGYLLSDTSAAIVKLCDGARTIAEIVATLCAAYPEGDARTVETDVLQLLDQLRARALLREADESAGAK